MLITFLLRILRACVLKIEQDYFCHIIIRPVGEVLFFFFKLSRRFWFAAKVENSCFRKIHRFLAWTSKWLVVVFEEKTWKEA